MLAFQLLLSCVPTPFSFTGGRRGTRLSTQNAYVPFASGRAGRSRSTHGLTKPLPLCLRARGTFTHPIRYWPGGLPHRYRHRLRHLQVFTCQF